MWPLEPSMLELGALALLAGGAVLTAFFALAVVLKAVLWVVLLPIRLVFWTLGGLLFLPLLIVKGVIAALLLVLALPVLAVAGLALLVAFGAVLVLPLLPLALLAAVIWYVVRPDPHALARG